MKGPQQTPFFSLLRQYRNRKLLSVAHSSHHIDTRALIRCVCMCWKHCGCFLQIDWTFNYLDLEVIESKKPNHVRFKCVVSLIQSGFFAPSCILMEICGCFWQFFLTVDGKLQKFYTAGPTSERVDQMILHLVSAIKSIFPAAPFEYVLFVSSSLVPLGFPSLFKWLVK